MTDTRTYRELDDANEWTTEGAAERLIEFVSWWGDGILEESTGEGVVLHSRDIDAVVRENEQLLDRVEEARGLITAWRLDAAATPITSEWETLRRCADELEAALAAAPAAGEETT